MLIFMLNERKSEKAAGAGAAYSAPPDPLAVTGGARPLPYPPPLVNIVIRPPPSRNPGSAADERASQCD